VKALRGEFSEEVVKRWPRAHVYAIEPSPAMHSELERLPDKSLYKTALGAKKGSSVFHINSSSIASSATWVMEGHIATVEVPTITLSDVMDATGTEPIELVKMDIEGAKIEILKTLPEKYLSRIWQLSVEYHDFLCPEHAAEIAVIDKRLSAAGFSKVNFSWPKNLDILYFKRRAYQLGPLTATLMQARVAYWRWHKSLARRRQSLATT
jgi:FkbM family methyltransferase